MRKADLSTDEKISVLSLTLKQLGLTKQFGQFIQKPTKQEEL